MPGLEKGALPAPPRSKAGSSSKHRSGGEGPPHDSPFKRPEGDRDVGPRLAGSGMGVGGKSAARQAPAGSLSQGPQGKKVLRANFRVHSLATHLQHTHRPREDSGGWGDRKTDRGLTVYTYTFT